jgi:hypothetical protein
MRKTNNDSEISSPRQDIRRRKADNEGPDERGDHRYYEQVYEEQRIKYLEHKFDKKALESFKCSCMVCTNSSKRKF